MLDVTVKKLDGRNHSFSVPDDITVRQFKEHIAASIEIRSEVQRLIYRGQVLSDERKINDYDVNGKTIHVVERAPPPLNQTGADQAGVRQQAERQHRQQHGGAHRAQQPFNFMGTGGANGGMQNFFSQVLSDLGRNAQVTTHNSADGSSMDVHINVDTTQPPGGAGAPAGERVRTESANRIRVIRKLITSANQTLERLENPEAAEAAANSSSGSADESMQTESTAATTANSAGTTAASTDATSTGTAAAAAASTAATAAGGTESSNGEAAAAATAPSNPGVDELAGIVDEVLTLNDRTRPHLHRYQQLLREDPDFSDNERGRRGALRDYEGISELIHHMGHVYHNMSDLMVDYNSAPPRQLRANPTPVTHHATAIMQHTIPVQVEVQINVAHIPLNPQQAQPDTSSQGSQTSTATTSEQSTNTSSQNSSAGFSSAGFAPAGFGPGGLFGSGWGGMGATSSSSTQTGLGSGGVSASSQTSGPSTASTGTSTPQGPQIRFGDMGGQGGFMYGMPPPRGFPLPFHPAPGGAAMMGPFVGGMPPPGIHVMFDMAGQQGGRPQAPPTGQNPAGTDGGTAAEMIQNIVNMATNAALRSTTQGQVFVMGPEGGVQMHSNTSSASSSSSTSSSAGGGSARTDGAGRPAGSTTTTTSATGADGGAQGARPRVPPQFRAQGPPLFPSFNVDPHLPCQSRHFITQRAELAAQAMSLFGGRAAAAGSNSDNNAASDNTANTNDSAQNNPVLANLVTDIMASLFQGGDDEEMEGGVGGVRGGGGGVEENSRAARDFMDQLRRGEQPNTATAPSSMGAQPGMSSASQLAGGSAPHPGTSQASGQPMDTLFSRILSGVTGQLFGDQQNRAPRRSISDFLSSLGHEYRIGQGEGVLTDLFNVLAQHLSFADLMALFLGDTGSLEGVLIPLQNFVRTSVLQEGGGEGVRWGEAQEARLRGRVEEIVNGMEQDIRAATVDVRGVGDVDVVETIRGFLKHAFYKLLLVIMTSQPGSGFPARITGSLREVLRETASLAHVSLEGGVASLDTIISNRLAVMASDVNPNMRQWMIEMAMTQYHQLMEPHTLNPDPSLVQRFIVHSAPQSRPVPDISPGVGEVRGEGVKKCSSSSSHDSFTSAASSMDEERADGELDGWTGAPRISGGALSRVPPPLAQDSSPSTDVNIVIGSEDWHSAVPVEWIPVMTRDAVRQRRPATDPPFSDAYISGMPSKRRKMMGQSRVEGLGEAGQSLPDSVERAAARVVGGERVGGGERVVGEELRREVGSDQQLIQAFTNEVHELIRQRISEDPAYTAHRYPSTEEYFNSTSNDHNNSDHQQDNN